MGDAGYSIATYESMYARLGEAGLHDLLDRGRRWSLGATLCTGGTIIFPHAHPEDCGHQIAAAVHACLDTGAPRVVVLGVIHALTEELRLARERIARGGSIDAEPLRGIQGPGFPGRDEWRREFSLVGFHILLDAECRRRGTKAPEIVPAYPFLAGSDPASMPGMEALQAIAKDAIVLTTMDPFHHGIGYGDAEELARAPEDGGLQLAREKITEGIRLLGQDDYRAYHDHCVEVKSDARDTGQVLRHLLGPLEGEILDLAACDTQAAYGGIDPTWVATALIELMPRKPGL